jgi:hypothetical protein
MEKFPATEILVKHIVVMVIAMVPLKDTAHGCHFCRMEQWLA